MIHSNPYPEGQPMNVSEANAVNTIAQALGVTSSSEYPPDADQVVAALMLLATQSYKRLSAGVNVQQVDAWEAGAIIPTPALAVALQRFRQIDPQVWLGAAATFSCVAAEHFAELLELLDRSELAADFLEAHKTADRGALAAHLTAIEANGGAQ